MMRRVSDGEEQTSNNYDYQNERERERRQRARETHTMKETARDSKRQREIERDGVCL